MVCGGCNSSLEILTLPALASSPPGREGPERRIDASEGSCFFHPESKAHCPCELCGRFLCSLCDLEIQGRHLCPSCLESDRNRQQLDILAHRRFIPDRAALALATVPLVFYPALLFTVPVGLYFAIRSFGPARSLVPEGRKRRAVVALVLFLLEIILLALGLRELFR
jgi:hypothetical protein